MKDKIKVGDSRPTFLQLCRNSRIPKQILEFLSKKYPLTPKNLAKSGLRSKKRMRSKNRNSRLSNSRFICDEIPRSSRGMTQGLGILN